MPTDALLLYAACPEPGAEPIDAYVGHVRDVVRWCDAAGYEAMLIPSGNRHLDAWALAQLVLQESHAMLPIVSVQPLYAHPYAVAKKVATLARLYGRMPHLNLLAGESRADRLSLDDRLSHRQQAERVTEYGALVTLLLTATRPVQHEGQHYCLYKPATLAPAEPAIAPTLFVTGNGDASREVAKALGATKIEPIAGADVGDCLRLGLIARPDSDAAWEIARGRFPDDPAARLNHRLELALGDSAWQQRVTQLAAEASEDARPLWLGPFESRRAASAYVVGAYRTVSGEILRHLRAGIRRFLLEPPFDQVEVEHTAIAFDRARARHASPLGVAG